MNVLFWHVHGSWSTAFVQGKHTFYVPVLPDRGPDGRGRAQTWTWPENVHEVSPDELQCHHFDLVVLQRPNEYDLVYEWLGYRPGVDIPAVYVEHNAPQGRINEMRHPMAGVEGVPVVHVTHFNQLFWDCGDAKTFVIEHGIVDPGYRYTGEVDRAAVVINEPQRRARVTGTDLISRFNAVVPVDLFGMGVRELAGYENLPQDILHDAIAKRRIYVHLMRWTSLGLSLIEAMQLGMPVVALATTEVPNAVPAGTGFISTDVGALLVAGRALLNDLDLCVETGVRARTYARERFGLERFLSDWDRLFQEIVQ